MSVLIAAEGCFLSNICISCFNLDVYSSVPLSYHLRREKLPAMCWWEGSQLGSVGGQRNRANVCPFVLIMVVIFIGSLTSGIATPGPTRAWALVKLVCSLVKQLNSWA